MRSARPLGVLASWRSLLNRVGSVDLRATRELNVIHPHIITCAWLGHLPLEAEDLRLVDRRGMRRPPAVHLFAGREGDYVLLPVTGESQIGAEVVEAFR